MELYNEKWENIPGYEGFYQASDLGRIKSLDRNIVQIGNGGKKYERTMKGKIIKQRLQNSNYNIVWLSVDGRIKPLLVHRLIALAFIKNEKNKPCINHKNGDKADNRKENLEWCTYSENITHAHKLEGRKTTEKKIFCIELNREFKSQTEASKKLGINRCSISHALNGINNKAGGYTWIFSEGGVF